MWPCAQSLTFSHLPPELSHWWGGRRGRTGGGGAVLWGATDRDGMGGPGDGTQGESVEKQLPTQWPHQDITLGTTPHPTLLLFFSSSLFFTHTTLSTSCYGGLTCACLCWTSSPPVGSMSRTQFVSVAKLHDLSAERWCSQRQQNKNQGQNKPLSIISESQFPNLNF